MERTETFEEMKERILHANALLDDLRQVERIIDFIGAYGGEDNEDHPMQLELRARFYPDDCLTNPDVDIREACYEDKTFLLATLMGPHLEEILADYQRLILGKIKEAAGKRIIHKDD